MNIEDIEKDLSLQIKSPNSILERKIKTFEYIDVKEPLIKNMSNSSNAEKKPNWREIFYTEAFAEIMSKIPAMSIFLAEKGKSRDEIKNTALIAIKAVADTYKEIYSGKAHHQEYEKAFSLLPLLDHHYLMLYLISYSSLLLVSGNMKD